MKKTIIKDMGSRISQFFKRAGVILTSYMLAAGGAYCGVFEKANSATDAVTKNLLELGKKLFPLSIIICVVALFVTHDERKLQMEIKITLGLCVGYVLLLLATNGAIASTLDEWFS